MVRVCIILVGLFFASHALAERFLITCTLTKVKVKCFRDIYGMNQDYTLDDMEKDHEKALAKYASITKGADCQRKDMSDRQELRLVSVCLDKNQLTVLEFRTIWPTHFSAINYYKKRDNKAIARKMLGQSRVRDRHGGSMPSGKDSRYN